MKRIEVVKDPRFWAWWTTQPLAKVAAETAAAAAAEAEAHPAVDASAADAAPDSSSTPAAAPASSPAAPPVPAKVHDPSTLPFSLYHTLITEPQPWFDATFPWFTLRYSSVEREIFAAQQAASKENAARKAADDRGATLPAAAPGSGGRHVLSTVSASLLASVPGNPQPLSLAMGLSPDSNLSRDELRAKRRMDFLSLKQSKREKREQAREYMRQREREHQQRKMQEYTSKYQMHRRKAISHVAQPQHEGATAAAAAQDALAAATESAAFAPSTLSASFSGGGSSHSSGGGASDGGRWDSVPPRRSASMFDESTYPEPRKSRRAYNDVTPPPGWDDDARGDGRGGYGRGGESARASSAQRHQKNRAGDVQTFRHVAHAPGKIEQFGARPTPAAPTSFSGSGERSRAVASVLSAASAAAAAPRVGPARKPAPQSRPAASQTPPPSAKQRDYVVNADGSKTPLPLQPASPPNS